MILKIVALIGASVIIQTNARAADCANYPYNVGVELLTEGTASYLVSTEEASTSGRDRASMISARREAEIMAKARLSEYFELDIESMESVTSDRTTSRVAKGDDVSIVSSEVKRQLLAMKTNSKSKISGARTIAVCFNREKYFTRATVFLPVIGQAKPVEAFSE